MPDWELTNQSPPDYPDDQRTSLYVKLQENTLQAQTLVTLRDTLLPRLISGRLRLPEAKTQIEEAIA